MTLPADARARSRKRLRREHFRKDETRAMAPCFFWPENIPGESPGTGDGGSAPTPPHREGHA